MRADSFGTLRGKDLKEKREEVVEGNYAAAKN